MNVAKIFLSQCDRSRPAVLAGESTLTYGELETSVQRLGLALLAAGLRKGDPVGLWSENSPFFVIAYLAIIRAQLVVVPFQTDISESTFTEIGRGCGMKAVLVSRRYAGRIKPWIDSLGLWMIAESTLSALPPTGGAEFPNSGSGNDLAALMFTSGSTGVPKGVMVTHRNLECNTRDIVSYMGLSASDRVMVVLPFHYCFGLSLLHSHLMAGGSVGPQQSISLSREGFGGPGGEEMHRAGRSSFHLSDTPAKIKVQRDAVPGATLAPTGWRQIAQSFYPGNPAVISRCEILSECTVKPKPRRGSVTCHRIAWTTSWAPSAKDCRRPGWRC